jgi:tRNA1Val (adenine37-N6)-methyltransferase
VQDIPPGSAFQNISSPVAKKHPCPDCSFCQWCSDDRCALCLRTDSCCRKKLSIAEQIALYDVVNRKNHPECAIDETEDILREYDLKIIQPKNGYRFCIDPVLLCEFAGGEALKILDLGCGCGIMPLIMARKSAGTTVVGVEFQPEMVACARRNVVGNNLAHRVEIIEADIMALKGLIEPEGFDLVISNPPYRKPSEGKTSPKAGRDLARHESTASLTDFLAAAKRLVKPGGSVCMIHHPERLTEMIAECRNLKLCPVRLQMVHGTYSLPARIFMIELLKGKKRALEVLPPIAVREPIYGERPQVGMRRE